MSTATMSGLDLDLLNLIPSAPMLHALAQEKHAEYTGASPYPHVCLDNFLPEAVAEAALAAFPSADAIPWKRFNDDHEVKLATEGEENIPPAVRNILGALNSARFLRFLEVLTGIPGLIPDPYFVGGGLHQIVPGGKLNIHIDFNVHDRMKLDRRLNLLIYLNKDWQESYGGQFEVWNTDGKSCNKKYLPIFNRCVIFSTSEISYHGNPTPVQCPPGRTRKSLALYYYSNGRPEVEKGAVHSTMFIAAPGQATVWNKALKTTKAVARELLPPVVYRLRGHK